MERSFEAYEAARERARSYEENQARVARERDIAKATTTDMALTGNLNGEWVLGTIPAQMDGDVGEDVQEAAIREYEKALIDAAHEIGGVTWHITRSQAVYPAYRGIDPEDVCARAVEQVDAWEIIARHTGQ